MTEVPGDQTGLEPVFPQHELPRYSGTQTFYEMSCKDNNRPIGVIREKRSHPDNPFNELARWFVDVVRRNGGSMPDGEARQQVAEGYGIPVGETWYGIAEAKDRGLLVQVHNTDPLTLPVEKARAEIDEILDGIEITTT